MAFNPINAFHERRRLVFSIYNKSGYDAARQVARESKSPQWQNGLEAELLFYEKRRENLQLSPALDAGEKADFAGIENGKAFHVDVTTNLAFKNASQYAEVMQKQGRPYYVALVDLKREQIELYPLRFP